MDRSYIDKTTRELELLFEESFNGYDILVKIDHELSFRRRQKAINLRGKVQQRLAELGEYPKEKVKQNSIEIIINSLYEQKFSETLHSWRSYVLKLSDNQCNKEDIRRILDTIYEIWEGNFEDHVFFILVDDELRSLNITDNYSSGILSHFGYRVHVRMLERRSILVELMNAYIPPVVNYKEWGRSNSHERKKKMLHTLSGLAFPHRNQKEFIGAVKVWDDDCEFIKKYY